MTFRYKRYGPDIVRPVIPIDILHGGSAITYEVLVDSGADECIFDAQIGELLGIDVPTGRRRTVSGITGTEEVCYVHPVTIRVGKHLLELEAGFLPRMGRFGYGVVGQKGFFHFFIVKFDLRREEIELKIRA